MLDVTDTYTHQQTQLTALANPCACMRAEGDKYAVILYADFTAVNLIIIKDNTVDPRLSEPRLPEPRLSELSIIWTAGTEEVQVQSSIFIDTINNQFLL